MNKELIVSQLNNDKIINKIILLLITQLILTRCMQLVLVGLVRLEQQSTVEMYRPHLVSIVMVLAVALATRYIYPTKMPERQSAN